MKIVFFTLFSFVCFSQTYINGYVRDSLTGEPLIGVNIITKEGFSRVETNNYGYFSIQTESSKVINFSIIGYKNKQITVKDSFLKIFLTPQSTDLEGVTVSSSISNQVSPEIGTIKISSLQLKSTPALLGEKDALKIIQLMPGVQKGVEGSSSLFVRGGGSDQNLVILDDAIVYNANHFFGLFSVFNADAVKDISFQKGGFSAKYGGRISSIIDISMKEGNNKKIMGEGGIGLLTSRFLFEGPINKKTSFLIAARRTNLDPVLKLFQDKKEPLYYRFYDFNAKINFDFNEQNKFFLSGFFGNDALQRKSISNGILNSTTSSSDLIWGNATATLRWNHLFNLRWFTNTTLAFTDFKSSLADNTTTKVTADGLTTSRSSALGSAIRDYTLKSDIEFVANNKLNYQAGVFTSTRFFNPKVFTDSAILLPDTSKKYKNNEIGLYLAQNFRPTTRWNTDIGVRYLLFAVSPKIYHLVEPRFSASYELKNRQYLKFAYSRMNQAVNLLGSSGFGLSTDLWVPSTAIFKPQQSENFSIGYERFFLKNKFTFTWEIYGRRLRNLLSFKDGVSLAVVDSQQNFDWEKNVVIGNGVAYGNEFLFRKNEGKLTGWVSYTYAKVIHRFEVLNSGKPFYPIQDRRHDLSIIGAYQINKRFKLAATWIYTTGNPVTLPTGFYRSSIPFGNQNSTIVNYYGGKNASRLPDYHRLDLALTLFPKKKRKYVQSSWEFGLYNAYFRKNPFDSYLKIDNTPKDGARLQVAYGYLLPILPSINYNFKF